MTEYKKIIAGFGCMEGQAVSLDADRTPYAEHIWALAQSFCDNGADELFFYDLSQSDEGHEKVIGLLKETARTADAPIITGGRIKRLEDVKKYLYAGAKAVFLDVGNEENVDIMKEAADRFGEDKIYAWLPSSLYFARIAEYAQLGASVMIAGFPCSKDDLAVLQPFHDVPFLFAVNPEDTENASGILFSDCASGVICLPQAAAPYDVIGLKQQYKTAGIPVDTYESTVSWDQLKLNSDGMVPVIVQDYRTLEVLMMAYMDKEAFESTVHTGKMTYYSRSRQCLWLKGETSGHYQYLKELCLDCDNDTLLAKVNQIGAACHTGSRSCFFQTIVKKEYQESNPLRVFEEVFSVILDRKIHPKEGSYTNYLFDKGIDKILKKVGEEATEIVIAAKNPDPEEVKYEISDFLYHVMVLMAEKGVTWEDITKELANR